MADQMTVTWVYSEPEYDVFNRQWVLMVETNTQGIMLMAFDDKEMALEFYEDMQRVDKIIMLASEEND